MNTFIIQNKEQWDHYIYLHRMFHIDEQGLYWSALFCEMAGHCF